jgi:hypothetical protein
MIEVVLLNCRYTHIRYSGKLYQPMLSVRASWSCACSPALLPHPFVSLVAGSRCNMFDQADAVGTAAHRWKGVANSGQTRQH